MLSSKWQDIGTYGWHCLPCSYLQNTWESEHGSIPEDKNLYNIAQSRKKSPSLHIFIQNPHKCLSLIALIEYGVPSLWSKRKHKVFIFPASIVPDTIERMKDDQVLIDHIQHTQADTPTRSLRYWTPLNFTALVIFASYSSYQTPWCFLLENVLH